MKPSGVFSAAVTCAIASWFVVGCVQPASSTAQDGAQNEPILLDVVEETSALLETEAVCKEDDTAEPTPECVEDASKCREACVDALPEGLVEEMRQCHETVTQCIKDATTREERHECKTMMRECIKASGVDSETMQAHRSCIKECRAAFRVCLPESQNECISAARDCREQCPRLFSDDARAGMKDCHEKARECLQTAADRDARKACISTMNTCMEQFKPDEATQQAHRTCVQECRAQMRECLTTP